MLKDNAQQKPTVAANGALLKNEIRWLKRGLSLLYKTHSEPEDNLHKTLKKPKLKDSLVFSQFSME